MTSEGQPSEQQGHSRPRHFRRPRRIPPPKDPATVSFLCDVMLGKLARELRLLGIDCEYERNLGGMAAYRVARQRGRILLSRANRLHELPGVLFVQASAVEDQVAIVKKAIEDGLAPAEPVTEAEPTPAPPAGAEAPAEQESQEPHEAPAPPAETAAPEPEPVAVERKPPPPPPERRPQPQRRPPERAPAPEAPTARCVSCNTPLEKITREQARPLVPFFVYQIHYDFKRCPKCQKVFWPGDHVAQMQQRREPRPGPRRRRPGHQRGAPPAG